MKSWTQTKCKVYATDAVIRYFWFLIVKEAIYRQAKATGRKHGSMTSMPHLQAMEWDFAERLSHITRGTTEAYYNYDGSGERVRKVVEKGGVIETRLYLGGFEIFRKKVGNNVELERETLHVMDDTKRVAIVDTLTIDNGVAVNNIVSMQRYQLSNNIESATLELDENADIISYEEYYPYGETSYRAGRSANEVSQKRYRYTGKEKDDESGLYYHSTRYYASWLGRWTAADPAGLVDGANLYMYCRGNPVKLCDPSGNAGIDEQNATTPSRRFAFEPAVVKGDPIAKIKTALEPTLESTNISHGNENLSNTSIREERAAKIVTENVSKEIFGRMSGKQQLEYLISKHSESKSEYMSNQDKGTLASNLRDLRDSMKLDYLFKHGRDFMNEDLRDFLNLKEDGTMNYNLNELRGPNSDWEETWSIAALFHQNAVINPRYLNAKFVHKSDGREVVFNYKRKVVLSDADKGTFNYMDGTFLNSALSSIPLVGKSIRDFMREHTFYDVKPYEELMEKKGIKYVPRINVFWRKNSTLWPLQKNNGGHND